jgi:hypothetical protein
MVAGQSIRFVYAYNLYYPQIIDFPPDRQDT